MLALFELSCKTVARFTLLAGEGGVGKSILALHFAAATGGRSHTSRMQNSG